mgnify:CR=1 FL=1
MSLVSNLKDGVLDFVTGGSYSSNKHARDQADRTNKQNKKIDKFNEREADRSNDYAAESLRITKDNNNKNRKFETETLKSAYRHGRAIQKFEDQQALKESGRQLPVV